VCSFYAQQYTPYLYVVYVARSVDDEMSLPFRKRSRSLLHRHRCRCHSRSKVATAVIRPCERVLSFIQQSRDQLSRYMRMRAHTHTQKTQTNARSRLIMVIIILCTRAFRIHCNGSTSPFPLRCSTIENWNNGIPKVKYLLEDYTNARDIFKCWIAVKIYMLRCSTANLWVLTKVSQIIVNIY